MLANRTCTRTRKRAHAHKKGIRGIENSFAVYAQTAWGNYAERTKI